MSGDNNEQILLDSEPGIVREQFEDDLSVHQVVVGSAEGNYVCCVAGAGSGKTRTLIYRCLKEIENANDFRKVLMLSFTKNACKELRERFSDLFGRQVLNILNVSTFHSFFLSRLNIKRVSDGQKPISPMEDSQSKEVLSLLYKNVRFQELENFGNSDILGKINQVNFKTNVLKEKHENELELHFFKSFQEKLRNTYSNNKFEVCDFFDILVQYYIFLGESSEELEFLKNFMFIFLDEFQDMDDLTYLIMKRIQEGNSSSKFFVAGDPEQNIYAILGNTTEFLERMKVDLPSMKIFYLKKNFRSTSTINYALECVVKQENGSRKDVPGGFTECIFHVTVESFKDQFDVVENVLNMSKEENKTCFVLSRTNVTVKYLSKFLERRKVPHELWTDVKKNESRVILSSVFRVKAGESDVVIIMNFNNYEFPHMCSSYVSQMLDRDREMLAKHRTTERRCVYVGMSRAKLEIWLITIMDTLSAPSFQSKRLIRRPGISPYFSYFKDLVVQKVFGAPDHPGIAFAKEIGEVEFDF